MHDRNDISMGVEHQSIVMCMPVESRALMSKPAVDVLAQNSWGILFHSAAKNMDDLIAEVEEGKCDLTTDDDGNVYRVAFVVTAKLQQPSGQLLVQAGKLDSEKQAHVKCQLPGTKVRAGELPREALMRLLNTKLQPFLDSIEITVSQIVESTGASKAYGLDTKYSKTVFSGTFRVDNSIVHRPTPKMSSIASIDCCEHDFFLVPDSSDDSTSSIFCWMSPEQLEDVSSNNEGQLQKSISRLDFGKLQRGTLSGCPEDESGTLTDIQSRTSANVLSSNPVETECHLDTEDAEHRAGCRSHVPLVVQNCVFRPPSQQRRDIRVE